MSSYVELHCHSNFSFQEGASTIEELIARAVDLGYPALALTDHDNLSGALRFARKAKRADLKPDESNPDLKRLTLIDASAGAGYLTVGELTIAPGKKIPMHIHQTHEEGIYIISRSKGFGQSAIIAAGQPRDARASPNAASA